MKVKQNGSKMSFEGLVCEFYYFLQLLCVLDQKENSIRDNDNVSNIYILEFLMNIMSVDVIKYLKACQMNLL
jgi:hypothetical protein